MKSRLEYFAAAPEGMKAMLALEHHVRNSGLEHSLIHLVKTRASQINGCAFCVHMHTRDARGAGETEERLYLLSAWRESPLYTPLERAAFLLHDVFDMDFEEIAGTLDRSAAACRQLASRARSHVRAARPRFHVGPEERAQVTNAFLAAARNGDTSTLRRLLAESVTLHSDGGGRKRAALRVLTGVDRICRLYACIARNTGGAPPRWSRRLVINGLPGRLSVEHDGTLQTIAFEFVHDRIAAIYVVRNPVKLAHLAHLVPETVSIDISARTHAPVSTQR